MEQILREIFDLVALYSVYSAISGVWLVYNIIRYAAISLGCFRMMRKVGMKAPWLAWIPFCNAYALGNLADRSNLLCESKDTTYRRKLLTWSIVPTISVLYMFVGMSAMNGHFDRMTPELWICFFASLASLIVYDVFYYVVLFKVYRLFAPSGAAGFTVLSIFADAAVPVLLLVLSKREPRLPFSVETETPPADADTGYGSI